MKKQRYFCLGISILILGMTGCVTEGNSTDNIPTPTVEIIEEEPIITQVAIFQKREENSKEENSSKKVITKTEGLCEVLEQLEPLESSDRYNSFNRMASFYSSVGYEGASLFCLDESTGVVYFVNQTKDNYLYRMKDGKVVLAVAMPVKEVYPYQGSVYFMVDSYNQYELQGMQSGDIYCYTPASGAVELVYAAGAIENSERHKLEVEGSEIYFSCNVKVKVNVADIYGYHLPFGETEPKLEEKHMTINGWKDYYLAPNSNLTLVLTSRIPEADGTREEVELPLSSYCYCVIGDILYCVEKTSISCTNLETREITYYDFVEAMKKMEINLEIEQGKRMIRWFTMTEDAVWVVTDYNIYRMDLESGEVTYGALSHNNKPYVITTLYTDGKEIYGVYYERSIVYPSERPVVRLLTDTMDTSGNAKVGIEFLVE